MPRDKDAVARELLVMRCRRGDRAALEELIRTWEGRLLYFLRRLVREEADAWDVLQKTWVKVLNGIGSLNEPTSLAPWLYRIARNTALSHARAEEPAHESLENHRDPFAADLTNEPFEFENAEQVHRGLLALSRPHREVLTLFFLEDLSVEEVATIVGVRSGTIKSRLHYAKLALRKVLEEEARVMNESKKQFVDRLLAADTSSPDARGRYEKEVRAMLEKSLSPRQRGVYLVAAVLLLSAVIFGSVASVMSASTPSTVGPEMVKFVSVYFIVSALALVLIAGVLFWAFWTGVVNLRWSRGWATGVGVVYIGLLGWMFMLTARYFPEMFHDDLRVLGLVLLVYAAVAWLRHRIALAEMKTAEKLLEIELRLAEIGEARPRPNDAVSPPQPPPA